MNRSKFPAGRIIGQVAVAIGTVAVALGATALAMTGAVPAQAATAPAAAAAIKVTPIPLNKANWSGVAGNDSRSPAWYRDYSGVIHLQGAVTLISPDGSAAKVIGRLQRSARPTANIYTVVHTWQGTFADLTIQTNGQIIVIFPRPPLIYDPTFVSLEGITYRPKLTGSLIRVNTANWSPNGGFGSRSPSWYRDSSGVIHLQGAASQTSPLGTGAHVIGTLSASARPSAAVFTIVHTYLGTYSDLVIKPSGQIIVIDSRAPATTDYTFVSLEGITYARSKAGSALALNTVNWSGHAGHGSRSPAWYKDSSGVIHLQGAAAQTSASGSSANMIGILPSAACPKHSVYVIVHTFNGTYADLAVSATCRLLLIDPQPPAIKDYTFVSLEGITYRR